MKKLEKHQLVSDENKYAYKCLKCGGELEQEALDSPWDNLSLDRMELYHCPKCGITFEYYYSLDAVQYTDDSDKRSHFGFKNEPGNDCIEIEAVYGEWVFPEETVAA